jgi:hypothetical protein
VDVSSDGRAETLDITEGLAEDVEIDVALTPSDDGSETEVVAADGTKGDEVKPDPTPTPRRGWEELGTGSKAADNRGADVGPAPTPRSVPVGLTLRDKIGAEVGPIANPALPPRTGESRPPAAPAALPRRPLSADGAAVYGISQSFSRTSSKFTHGCCG